jgi:hypothetical protein
VADVVQTTKARVLKALERRGVLRVTPEALEVDDDFAAGDPVLAQLALAAVAGLHAPAGLGPAGQPTRATWTRSRYWPGWAVPCRPRNNT